MLQHGHERLWRFVAFLCTASSPGWFAGSLLCPPCLQVNELSEGKVEYTYRIEPDSRWVREAGAGVYSLTANGRLGLKYQGRQWQAVAVSSGTGQARRWRGTARKRSAVLTFASPTFDAVACSPPDVQKITKQMAIVAWQPGPNRLLQVPTEVGSHVLEAAAQLMLCLSSFAWPCLPPVPSLPTPC